MKTMNPKTGFTIVETTLVLAISALMLMGFMAGIAGRIGAERYSDATYDYADFLRRIYTETINVEITRSGSIADQNKYCTLAGQEAAAAGNLSENPEDKAYAGYPGRSGCAVYGKVISFGEDSTGDTIYVYDVIGSAVDINHPLTETDTANELAAVYADLLSYNKNSDGTCSLKTAGLSEAFKPQWSTRIEKSGNTSELFKGAVMMVRSPMSGSVRTYVMTDQVLEVQKMIAAHKDGSCSAGLSSTVNDVTNNKTSLVRHIKTESNGNNNFELKDADFCIGSEQLFSTIGKRNNVRILADGRNVNSVLFVETDLSSANGGNRC